MRKRYFSVLVAVWMLLQLCACRAAFPGGSTEAPPVTQSTTVPTTAPAPQYLEVWQEGEVSQIPVQTVAGQCGKYTMAMDPAYFTLIPQADSDLFSYEDWGCEQPVYYLVIPYDSAYDPAAFVTQGVPDGYSLTAVESITLAGYPTTAVSLTGTGENAGYCMHKFLLDCGEISYSIEARFSIEMYEGLYAIMRACFETFRVS